MAWRQLALCKLGGVNGVYQILEDMTKGLRERLCVWFRVDKSRFSYRLACTLFTFILVDFAWIFFRADGLITAFRIIHRMFLEFNPWLFFDGGFYQLGLDQKNFLVMLFGLLVVFVVGLCKYNNIDLQEWLSKQGLWFRWSVYIVGIILVVIYGVYGSGYDAEQFIYFQF